MTVFDDIVKANDIRGITPTQLNSEVARCLGAAFADHVGGDVVVGYDMRQSSVALVHGFVEGALARGVNVTNIGLCSTDGLYYASGVLNRPGAMITASHNPAQYNGLKLCYARAQPMGYDTGLDQVASRAASYLAQGLPSHTHGRVDHQDMLSQYAHHLRALVPIRSQRRLRIVVDAGNGMAGLTTPAVFDTVLNPPDGGVEVIPMYFQLDGTFPHHDPNPLEEQNLVDLQAAVIGQQADLGLAFDGDADRCFFVDEKGVVINPSAITALVGLGEVQREHHRGRKPVVVRNLITSRAVEDLLTAAGAQVITTRVGHAFIKETMAEFDAVFGGEHSAHYYFRDFFYADSGMLAALHVLAALADSDLAASQITDMYSPHYMSGEINSRVGDVGKVLRKIRREFSQEIAANEVAMDETDGLTISHWHHQPKWWFNIRPSNTEPLLRLNVEAEDEDVMEKVRDEILRLIHHEENE